jgi:hypothetical protein
MALAWYGLDENMVAPLSISAAKYADLRVATEDHAVGTWRNVVILVWRRQTTVDGVRAAEKVYQHLSGLCPGGVILLTIVEESAPAPPADARRDLARWLASCSGRMILSAVVHEGAGFRGAMVRSVVTGLALVAKLPYPHKIFATVAEADAWYRANSPLARSWRDGELVDVTDDLRRRAADVRT